MANPLYTEQMNNSLMSQFGNFMQNPMQFLLSRKINIPQQYQSNPKDAVQYLLNNGQMSQETFNQLMSKASQMGINI